MKPSTSVQQTHLLRASHIQRAHEKLRKVVKHTPLEFNQSLSDILDAKVFLKREDLQIVRSYKLRGAYNKMASLSEEEAKKGIVCSSAGNHAQGVAYSCFKLGISGRIFMPGTTPRQKVRKVQAFGKDLVEIVLTGDTYDDAYAAALEDLKVHDRIFIHPFDDEKVMEGQGTVATEILADTENSIDFLFVPIGGGGLAAGMGSYFHWLSPHTSVIGVEPLGAPAMKRSLERGEVLKLEVIDKFVDGAAVKRVGERTFKICQEVLEDVALVPEGKVCSTILQLYNEDAIVVEPAGALSIAALDLYKERIKGKTVVCVISGSNNDITRTSEIQERSLLYEGLKHYFIIRFPQRAGAMREFLNNVVGPTDDITRFEYIKKNNRETGTAFVGIELLNKEDYAVLIERMKKYQVHYQPVNDTPNLFSLLV